MYICKYLHQAHIHRCLFSVCVCIVAFVCIYSHICMYIEWVYIVTYELFCWIHVYAYICMYMHEITRICMHTNWQIKLFIHCPGFWIPFVCVADIYTYLLDICMLPLKATKPAQQWTPANTNVFFLLPLPTPPPWPSPPSFREIRIPLPPCM